MTGPQIEILCVGYSADVLDDLRAVLPGHIATATGAAAAAVAMTPELDCVVSEYSLPDGDGLSLFDDVQSLDRDVPFFLYTDAGNESVAGDALARGVDGYVPASDGLEVLSRRLRTTLDTDEPTVESRRDRLELVYDQAPLAIVEANPNGDVTAWNSGARDLFGHEREEILGENLVETLVPESVRDDLESVCEQTLDGDGTQRSVNRNVTRDGEEITCEWYNTTLRDNDGEVVGALSFVRDVSDQIQHRQTVEDLHDTTRDLIRVEERRRVAEFAVEAARDVLGQPYASVFLYDEEQDALVATAMTDGLEEFFDDDEVLGDESMSWKAFESGAPVVLEADVNHRSSVPQRSNIQSGIFMPLGDHGTLAFATRERDAFDKTDVHMASILASTTTAALDRSAREEELRRHQTIVETAGDGVFALDSSGHIRTVNDAMTELTGYDQDELLGTHVSAVVEEEETDRGRCDVGSLLPRDESESETFEILVVTVDGTRVPCEATIAQLPADSVFDGTAVVVRDVTERREMADQLVEHKRKIENLHGIASALDDCETESAVWNLTVEAAEGILDFDICGVDSVDGEYLVSEALSSEIEPEGYKGRAHISDGLAGKTHRTGESYLVGDIRGDNEATPEKRTYRSLLSVPIGDRGVFQAVSEEVGSFDEADLELAELLASHVNDALERLVFEARLREERDRFAALFENVPDPVVYATHEDAQPVIVDVNPAFERVFGYDESEVLGELLDEFIVPRERRGEAGMLNARSQSGELVECEVKRRTADGLRDFLMTIVPVEFGQENPRTFGVYTDITERKEREKRVEILNRVLRHDLRNGMNIIKGSAEMLADVVEGTTAYGYADTIIDRSNTLIGLAEKTRAVERTLDRDRAASGPVDVRDCIETSISRLEPEYPDATVTADLPDEARARADDLLRTAIHHVIENALEHNDTPDPTVHVTVTEDEASGNYLRVSVADDGPGIPEDERALISEEKEITQLRHASGLGLWLVNWVVTQTGGRVAFTENEPRGSVVELTVPLARNEDTLRRTND
ncbi:PAS domain S-box protein [Haloarchaeobius sp. TZWWS8]|uniref:PAS domain S-box protein n=1 Tax=Haloarchaeobius sp. TZWWS8 TaxID=3446121 RepID=UPI003EBD11CC